MNVRDAYRADPRLRIVTGVCPHDCPDTCSWQVAVERDTGRAIDLWGHPDHPITRGRLCGKVDHYLDRTYHRDRVLAPLRRVGNKGEGRFEPCSWSEALGEIGARLRAVIDESGGEAVLPYSYCGTMGLLQGEGMAQRFFHRIGASKLARTICAEAGFLGHAYTTGRTMGLDTPDFAAARLILLWGTNTLTSNMHLWPFVQEARKQGARVIAIDPVRTRTARAADEWIPIRPGTDGALALGVMHVLCAENLVDLDYVERATVGFSELRERVEPWSPQRVAAVTGVPSETVIGLARAYATIRPAAIRINYGLQRHRGGGMAVRTLACLPALVGAWRERGGGIQLSTSGSFVIDRSGLERPDLLGDRNPRTINMNRLGDALDSDPDVRRRALHHPRSIDPLPTDPGPAVRALVVYNANPAAVTPDQGAVRRGLRRDDLLVVVLEHFLTDTADHADFVLPATTQLEHWDLIKPYGHLYFGLNRPAIAPVGEALPNSEIFRRLARAMDLDDPCFDEDDETILRDFVQAQRDPTWATVTWEALSEHGYARIAVPDPYLPFAEGAFPTESGRCELRSAKMERDGYPGLPEYTAPATAEIDDDALVCISPPAHSFLNSTFANLERFVARERGPCVLLHPLDAGARSITDGAMVAVYNELGTIDLPARITPDVMPGTIVAPGVWWSKLSPDHKNVNVLVPQDEADMGAGAVFYDVAVRVRPLAAD